ncbi:hypothetical protein BH24GEM2_BH24GEM2_13850 [soil metagenome]
MIRHCHGCGRPLELAKVLSRRYRKLRSGIAIGARAELLKLACECGATVTKLGTVMSVQSRAAA